MRQFPTEAYSLNLELLTSRYCKADLLWQRFIRTHNQFLHCTFRSLQLARWLILSLQRGQDPTGRPQKRNPQKRLPARGPWERHSYPAGGRQKAGIHKGPSRRAPGYRRSPPPGAGHALPEAPPRQGRPSRAPRGGELRAIGRRAARNPAHRVASAKRATLPCCFPGALDSGSGSSCGRRDGGGRAAGKQLQLLSVFSRPGFASPAPFGTACGRPRLGFQGAPAVQEASRPAGVKRPSVATFSRIALPLRPPFLCPLGPDLSVCWITTPIGLLKDQTGRAGWKIPEWRLTYRNPHLNEID